MWSKRLHVEEILDLGTASDREVQQSLADLRRMNRWLGGRRLLLKLLDEQLKRTGLQRFSLLDVGTGSGDLPEAVARDYPATVVGLDRQFRHFRSPGPQASRLLFICADVHHLPFRDQSFDMVSATLLLHHFTDDEAVQVLGRLAAVARHALLVTDPERHILPYYFFRLGFFARSPVTRWDAPVSIRRAFRKKEMEELARRAGFERWRVRKHLPFRLSLVAELS